MKREHEAKKKEINLMLLWKQTFWQSKFVSQRNIERMNRRMMMMMKKIWEKKFSLLPLLAAFSLFVLFKKDEKSKIKKKKRKSERGRMKGFFCLLLLPFLLCFHVFQFFFRLFFEGYLCSFFKRSSNLIKLHCMLPSVFW